ncbi:hypothetical protein AB0F96_24500 [Streptomyces sp. NPDC023998]|uniref:hypothetical protein n=1 Tax=Streptomyces sp. NPDC023998 TaxID=3154597 RepID=UPI0033FD1BD8
MTARYQAHLRRRWRIGLLALAMVLPVAWTGSAGAQATPGNGDHVVYQESVPTSATPVLTKDFRAAPPVTSQQHHAMQDALIKRRVKLAAQVPQTDGERGVPPATAPTSQVENVSPRAKGPTSPNGLVVARNNRNPLASTDECGVAASLAEPSAANDGPNVYYTGNFDHQEFSTDRGATFSCADPYPAGPAEAPFTCCDTQVIYDHARDVTFHSMLYLDDRFAPNNGIVRVFVRRNIPSPDNCYYDIDFDPSATDVLPDYPHLGLSKKFLYVSANRVSGPNFDWLGSEMRRLNLDQLAACKVASGRTINITNAGDQRILVPGSGAQNVMYFSWVNTPTQWRVFSWPDNSTAVGSTLHDVGAMTFGDADCRGGVNNTDWADEVAANIVGFNVQTAITRNSVNVWAPTDSDAGYPQAHIVGAQFHLGNRPNDLRLVQEPVIAFADQCAGLPAVGVNDSGDQGLAIALGGRAGGGGPAVTTAVGIKDKYNKGPGGFVFRKVAEATYNPDDARFGDYFTVSRNSPCGRFFDATGYGLLGGTDTANVNARYVEFGRGEVCR